MTPERPTDPAAADPRRTILMGLDGEMSGTELSEGHRLIQAGFAFRTRTGIVILNRDIGWDEGEMAWDEKAAAVHGIDRNSLAAAARAEQVDEEAEAFIAAQTGPLEGRAIISVGFNVAAFDHPFFRATLPRSMRNVSRRAIDLNSICFAMDGMAGDDGRTRSWERWKKEASERADGQLRQQGVEGRPHQAGWDAARALYALEHLRAAMRSASAERRGH